MAKSIGVGVIGIGMGSCMLPLSSDPESPFEVRSLCSRTESKVKALAKASGIAHWTTDFRELVRRPEIDVVGVYSPDHLHIEHVVAALEAGKHVVCTKPMVASLEDAERIVRLVDKTGLKFLVGQTMRFDPGFAAAKWTLDTGLLGEVIFVEGHYVHDLRYIYPLTPWRRDVPQDYLYGGVSHPIDVLRWYIGDVAEVHAFSNRGGLTPQIKKDCNFLLNLKFANGAIGRVMGAFDIVHPPMPMMGISLWGTKATAIADFTDQKGGHLKVVFDDLEGQPTGTFPFPPETEGEHGLGLAVSRYMRHFADCLENDAEPSPGVRDGAKSIATCAAAWESIKTGRVAKVKGDL